MTGYLRIGWCENCDAVGGRPDYKYQKGDTLWVRETWGQSIGITQRFQAGHLLYRADHGFTVAGQEMDLMKWRPSIHMPRWASRITLKALDVRAERLQEITVDDIYKEGLSIASDLRNELDDQAAEIMLREQFARLWNDINAKRGYPWESNPWVWRIEFEVKK
jgi:hypothetical protein